MKVVLVSGFGKPDFLWTHIKRSLDEQHQVKIFNYDFRDPLEQSLYDLDTFLYSWASNSPAVTIGHSMGGLLAARSEASDRRIAIASPLKGTVLTNFFPSVLAASAAAMRPGSQYLRALEDHCVKTKALLDLDLKNAERNVVYSPLMAIGADSDALVFPGSSSLPDFADETHRIVNTGHVSILFNKEVVDHIKRFIAL